MSGIDMHWCSRCKKIHRWFMKCEEAEKEGRRLGRELREIAPSLFKGREALLEEGDDE